MIRTIKFALALPLVLIANMAAAYELIMVDEHGCVWCARWEEEIGPAYPQSHEGVFAPLRKVNIRNIADEVEVSRRVNFTPTFLLVDEGREIARIEGYPGEHFFFPMVEQLLVKNTDYVTKE